MRARAAAWTRRGIEQNLRSTENMGTRFRFQPSEPISSVRVRFVEIFRLRPALALAQTLALDFRHGAAKKLTSSSERSQSAAVLWAGGHYGDGLRLAVDAFDEASMLLEEIAETLILSDDSMQPPKYPTGIDLLTALGVAARGSRLVERTRAAIGALELPVSNNEIDADLAAIFVDARAAHLVIRRALAPALRSPSSVKWLRARRLAISTAPLVVLAVLTTLAFMPPPATRAQASAVFNDRARYQAEKVLDHDPSSEWLLPNKSRGWLELVFDQPRRVEKVRILNAVNGRRRDRGTKDFIVQVYRRGNRIRSFAGTFPSVQARRTRREQFIFVGLSEVSKVRVEVRSWHKHGGGFAEVSVD